MPTHKLHGHQCRQCGWEWSCTAYECCYSTYTLCARCEDDYAEDRRADVEAAALGLPTRYLRCADDDQREFDF